MTDDEAKKIADALLGLVPAAGHVAVYEACEQLTGLSHTFTFGGEPHRPTITVCSLAHAAGFAPPTPEGVRMLGDPHACRYCGANLHPVRDHTCDAGPRASAVIDALEARIRELQELADLRGANLHATGEALAHERTNVAALEARIRELEVALRRIEADADAPVYVAATARDALGGGG